MNRTCIVWAMVTILTCVSLHAGDNAKYLNGTASIFYTQAGNVMIALDRTGKEGQDGFIDDLFLVQLDPTASRAPLDYFETPCTLLVTQRSIALDLEQEQLGIEAYFKGEFSNRTMSSTSGDVIALAGYGLSHAALLTGGTTINDLLTMVFDIQGGPVPQCTAGGPGSSHCSIGGCNHSPENCQVTCMASHYACCRCGNLNPTNTHAALCACIATSPTD